jgi:hypothetical protein
MEATPVQPYRPPHSPLAPELVVHTGVRPRPGGKVPAIRRQGLQPGSGRAPTRWVTAVKPSIVTASRW